MGTTATICLVVARCSKHLETIAHRACVLAAKKLWQILVCLDPGQMPEFPVREVYLSGSAEVERTVRLKSQAASLERFVELARRVVEAFPYLFMRGWVERPTANVLVVQQDDARSPFVDPDEGWMQLFQVSVKEFANNFPGKDTTMMVVHGSKASKYGKLRVEIYHNRVSERVNTRTWTSPKIFQLMKECTTRDPSMWSSTATMPARQRATTPSIERIIQSRARKSTCCLAALDHSFIG